jgi:DNA-binding phage protein
LVSIKRRERDAILQSLQAGVVPKIGLQHIQVGRKDEVEAIIKDLERIAENGSAVRFIIGRYGAGKSFFLNLARIVALEKKFVVVQADISPERRLYSTGGQARTLYSELMRNMCAGAKREGGALPGIVQRWVSDLDFKVREAGGGESELKKAIYEELKPLGDLVSGYDFATVISRYVEGFQKGDDVLMASALRWLYAEYTTKTQAKEELGVRYIIDDRDFYDYLKLMGTFVRMAGYSGLLVCLDEMGVLSHRLNNTQSRNSNFEMILRMVNDCLQGNVEGLGIIFAGTDDFLDDKRRGLASYEALASRLAENRFAIDGLKDFLGPVIRLQNLSAEDLYVLLFNIRNVFASGDPAKYLVPDEAINAFLNHCAQTLGSEFYQTPRDATKAFVGLLSVLAQNPGARWQDLIGTVELEQSIESNEELAVEASIDFELASFRL